MRSGRPWPGRAWVTLILLTALLVLGLVLVDRARADDLEREAREIARSLQCPVCQSVSVADSSSELAAQMRALIRKKLEAGEPREQIVAYFVERYGDSVLTEPPKRGGTLAFWLVPIAGVLAGLVILGALLRGWRANPAPGGVEPAGVNARTAEVLRRYEERVRREAGGPSDIAEKSPGT
ncbi:MAG: cytochrome c-type biogenesis protein CcmH [Chloroflexi bacterium]|nr:cytochrome c-type biogenesis protein CcmH [Chloroflexota bacterium]